MKRELIEANLEYFPKLSYKEISTPEANSSANSPELKQIEIFQSKVGLPVFKYNKKWAHSRFNPMVEAERKWKDKSYQGQKSWVYSQGNFLYEIEWAVQEIKQEVKQEIGDSVKKNDTPDQALYLFFENKFLFSKLLELRNLAFLSFFKEVEVYFPHQKNLFLEKINEIAPEGILSFYDPLNIIQSDFIKKVEKVILEKKKQFFSRNITGQQFQVRWLKNTILNLSHLGKFLPFNNLVDSFWGERVLLVGAGLSLQHLRKVMDQLSKQTYKIIAVDTALPYLIKNNLIPDFVISLDGGYANSLDFKNLLEFQQTQNKKGRIKKINLITPLFIYPCIMKNDWEGIYVFQVEEQKDLVGQVIKYLFSELNKFIYKKNPEEGHLFHQGNKGNEVQVGGSVASTLINLIKKMGFAQVDLIGFDFMSIFYQNHLFASMHFDYYYERSNRLKPVVNQDFQETTLALDKESKEELKQQKREINNLEGDVGLEQFSIIGFNMRKYKAEFIQALKNSNLKIGRVFSYNSDLKNSLSNNLSKNLFLSLANENNEVNESYNAEKNYSKKEDKKKINKELKELEESKINWLKKVNADLQEIKFFLEDILSKLYSKETFNFQIDREEVEKIKVEKIFPDLVRVFSSIKAVREIDSVPNYSEQLKKLSRQIHFYYRIINILLFCLKKIG